MKLMVKMLFCPEARIYHQYVAVQLEQILKLLFHQVNIILVGSYDQFKDEVGEYSQRHQRPNVENPFRLI